MKTIGGRIDPKSIVPSRESKEGEGIVGSTTGRRRVPVVGDWEGAGGSGGSASDSDGTGGNGGGTD